ncbi:acetyltransferase [Herbaspirillum sp. GCM10030257]|uniref:acetyltransferase n=1 Tax=Herbaspirillum sp. GCM10030257 TaxID=3273393 RepID=UPI0036230712
MTHYYAFNGDADGLCALQQLRLSDPRDAVLVTGVKRDIKLLQRIDAVADDSITVLDISLDQNREDLQRVLAAGAAVCYFDHHHAGELPRQGHFMSHIDESPEVCTSILVDRYLGGRHRAWAIVAAFGDSLPEVAHAMASVAGVDRRTALLLEQLGTCLNYNAYGETVADLHIDPAELARHMLPFADPLEFIAHSGIYARLAAGYEQDMQQARRLTPAQQMPGARLFMLPDEPWARRAIGVLANELMQAQPDCALGILSPKSCGGYTVSLRVPAGSAVGAAEFCRNFDTGGGRKLSGGINHLPKENVDHFASSFAKCFRT